jgi:DNA invertase Pin-like site-specific DNA recombinase
MIRIYTRVSSENQAKGFGLISQEDALKSFCLGAYPDVGIKVYVESAVSGTVKPSKRPAMSELLDDLQEGDVIIAREVSRLSRVVWHGAKFLQDMAKRKVVVSCLNAMDATETSYGAMIFHIMLAVSENERMATRERTELGVKAAKEKGQFTGGTLYFWEKLEDKKIVDDPEGLQSLRKFAGMYRSKMKQVDMLKHFDVSKGTMSRWCKYMCDKNSKMYLRSKDL